MMKHGGEEYLTADEASAYIGISRRTLDRHASDGLIKKYRRGIRSVVFRQSDVEWLKEHLQGIRSEEQDESK